MRFNIRHETTYTYGTPATRVIDVLRLAPRGHNGQFVINWRVDVDQDCRVDQTADPFGNIVHSFSADGPIESMSIVAHGRVETTDTSGVLSGQIERFPPVVFLRDTPLTESSAELHAFAEKATAGAQSPLDQMHGLMSAVRKHLEHVDDRTVSGTSAIEAFREGRGVYQDFAHVFIAAARYLQVPARYTSGYRFARSGNAGSAEQAQDGSSQSQRQNRSGGPSAGHAWAEALIEGLGWVGFDPVNDMCPTDAYVRVASGLDYLGAAPIRGVVQGGDNEGVSVDISLVPDGRGTA